MVGIVDYLIVEKTIQHHPALRTFIGCICAIGSHDYRQQSAAHPADAGIAVTITVGMVIMFSYALFGLMALIGIQGIIAHIRKDTASESKLAALSQFLLYPAVALIAVGIFIGAIWANVSWGKYWSWDAKETWALITMLIYAAPLHNDIRWMHKPLHIHIYMLIAFLSVLMTYFGVNYFLPGMHSYA